MFVAPTSLAIRLFVCVAVVPVVAGGAGAVHARGTGAKGGKSRASTVMVRSTTEGARVFIDGEMVGVIPQKLPIALAPGAHTIKVGKPGHSDYLDTFELKRGQELVLEIDLLALSGVLQVNSIAPGAIVAIDQRQIGEVPYDGEVPPGAHVLEVRAAGYSTFRKELSVIAGDTYQYDVTLVPLTHGGDDGAVTPWYGHWWVWAGTAAVVAGGVTAGILLSRSEAEATPRNQLPISLSDR